MNTVQSLNLSKLRKEHEHKWVALSPTDGQVLAAGVTLKEVQRNLAATGAERPIFHRVLPFGTTFTPWEHEV